MPLSFARKIALYGILIAGIPALSSGQTNYYATNGTEYAIVGSLPGDQVHPDVALNSGGGFAVWQDNITDGAGWGVSAMLLNSTLSGSGSSFRVNVQGAGDQNDPRVALLHGGGAAFVWQGGTNGFQHIYARFLSSSNTWVTGDVMVNARSNYFQINPAIATLANSNVVVVWSSFNQASSTSMQDVYGRIFSPSGAPVTGEFLVNSFTNYNQRSPAVAALAGGGFIVTWISEQQRATAPTPGSGSFTVVNSSPVPSVDVYAQIYDGNGVAQGANQLVDSDLNPCADPAVAGGLDGGFVVTWDARDMTDPLGNGLDIYARTFSSSGVGGTVLRVNSHLYGDQYAPRLAALGADYLIAWTSLAQDGSLEGVYGQLLRGNGSFVGTEFRVNTTTASSQIQPVVASDGTGQFLAIWTSFTGLTYGFDLFAQRYINTQQPLEALPAPFVYAPFLVSNGNYLPQLLVSWPAVTGLSVSNYEVYVDGASMPTFITTSNVWTFSTTASSTHSFRVDYVATDGRKSPLSPSASGTTWSGANYYGIPFEWMELYYGYNFVNWPTNVNAPLSSGGLSLMQVFLSGGNPLQPGTWLRTTLTSTPEGLFLSWNAQPGFTYQVQSSATLGGAWTNLGAPRFAAGTTDSIFVGKSSGGYYRILLLRQ